MLVWKIRDSQRVGRIQAWVWPDLGGQVICVWEETSMHKDGGQEPGFILWEEVTRKGLVDSTHEAGLGRQVTGEHEEGRRLALETGRKTGWKEDGPLWLLGIPGSPPAHAPGHQTNTRLTSWWNYFLVRF